MRMMRFEDLDCVRWDGMQGRVERAKHYTL